MTVQRALILGAAGRDFHDFLVFFRDHPHYEVMTLAARAQSAGASFALLGPAHTELRARRPVIAVTATRTGVGKSPFSQWLAQRITARGLRVGVLRHPMPYGDLARQRVQRFATLADLDAHACTIEEREEYRPYIQLGIPIYAGVDYAAILDAAQADADVIVWDGGNNDTAFLRADLRFTLADALRPGQELSYYPAQTNIRTADVVLINKVDEARREDIDAIAARVAAVNPRATIALTSFSPMIVGEYAATDLSNRRVLVIEDSPTITHGGMAYGAGMVAARRAGARDVIDPRPFARGSIRETFERFPHIGPVLPALGYSPAQREDLAVTIAACAPDFVVDASPAEIARELAPQFASAIVDYPFVQRAGEPVEAIVDAFLERHGLTGRTRPT